MEIKTKLDIEDNCYFLKDNKVTECVVRNMQINVSIGVCYSIVTSIKYTLENNSSFYESEDKLFKTKEELIQSL